LTEFTKRRDWPMKVIKEMKDILLILDANGRLKHASPAILALTGYTQDEMMEVFMRDIIHPDDVGVFVAEMNESIATGTPLQIFFRLKKKDGNYQIFEAVGHAHIAAAKYAPNPSNQSAFCQAVFMMARPYPTKNTGLLDSFLEHKIENERLKRRIAELRKEEADDAEESQRTWRQSQEGRSEMGQSEDTYNSITTPVYQGAVGDHSMRPPEKPSSSSNSLTRENLEGMSGARPDSIRDKMARYEGSSHADTIEMLTGLRYQEGERSRGITTGNASPTLIRGDAGIAIPVDRDPRTGEKKKKLKVAEEYVCTDCGTLDSPEWRKGPSGPKTLCNACGLRWAKKEKKMKNSGGGGMSMMESH
jgi:PAS domain S-box-containing protein